MLHENSVCENNKYVRKMHECKVCNKDHCNIKCCKMERNWQNISIKDDQVLHENKNSSQKVYHSVFPLSYKKYKMFNKQQTNSNIGILNNIGTPNINIVTPNNNNVTPNKNNGRINNNNGTTNNIVTSKYIIIPNYIDTLNNNGTSNINNGTPNKNNGRLNNGTMNNIITSKNIPNYIDTLNNNGKSNNYIGTSNINNVTLNNGTPNKNSGIPNSGTSNNNARPDKKKCTTNSISKYINIPNSIHTPNNNGTSTKYICTSNNNNGTLNNNNSTPNNSGALNNYTSTPNNNVRINNINRTTNNGIPNNSRPIKNGTPKSNISMTDIQIDGYTYDTDPMEQNDILSDTEIDGYNSLQGNAQELSEILNKNKDWRIIVNYISTSNNNDTLYNYNSTPSNKTCLGPNNSKLYDLRFLLLQSGDIETNPGPNKSRTITNRKISKNIIDSPNKNNLFLMIVILIQMLVLLKSYTQHKINTETQAPGNHSMDIKIGTNHIVIHRVSMIYKQYKLCYWHKRKTKNNYNTHKSVLILLLLLLGGDIELNPGPRPIYPCGICE